MQRIIVTGGAGFIGANYIHHLFENPDFIGYVLNIDKLTYAGNLESLKDIEKKYPNRYFFEQVDIADTNKIASIFEQFQPDTIVNFAAESHVDRSYFIRICDINLFKEIAIGIFLFNVL